MAINYEFPRGIPLDKHAWERAECNFRVSSNKNTIGVTTMANELAKTGNITNIKPVPVRALPDNILCYILDFNDKKESKKKPKKLSINAIAKQILADDKKLKKNDPNKVGYQTDGQISNSLSKISEQVKSFKNMPFPGLTSDVIDIKIYGLYCLAKKVDNDQDRVELFTTLLSMRTKMRKMIFVNYMKSSQIISISSITTKLLNDAIEMTTVDLVQIAKTNRESLYFSRFDTYLPGGNVKLYDHQIRLINTVKQMGSEVYFMEKNLFDELQCKMRELSANKLQLINFVDQIKGTINGENVLYRLKTIQTISAVILEIKTKIAKVQASDEYQRAANKAIIDIAPTGTGKSVAIAAAAIGYLRNRPGSSVLISVGYGQQGIEATCMNLDSCRETDGYAVITVINGKLKITPRFGCDKNCKIFIGTPDAVKAFIDKYPDGKLIAPNHKDPKGQPLQNTRFTYLVIHDEITGTDQGPVDLSNGEYYNTSLIDFHEVIKRAQHFVLLSATTPVDAMIKFDVFKKFAQVEIIEDQKLTPLSIELFNSENGERLLPHTGIKTKQQCINLIHKLKTCPMTRRCYTVDVFIELCIRLNYEIKDWLNDINNIKNIPAKLIEILEEKLGECVEVEAPFRYNKLPDLKHLFSRTVKYDEKIVLQAKAEFLCLLTSKLMEKTVSKISGLKSLSPQQLDEIMSDAMGVNNMDKIMDKIMTYSFANGTYKIANSFALDFNAQCLSAIDEQMAQNIKSKNIATKNFEEEQTEEKEEKEKKDEPLNDLFINAFAHIHPASTYKINYDDIVNNFNFGGQILVACKNPQTSAIHMLSPFINKCLSSINNVPLDKSFNQDRELIKFFQVIDAKKAQIIKQESSHKKMADGEAAKEMEIMMRDDNNSDITSLYRLPEQCYIGTPKNAKFVGSGLGLRNHCFSIDVEKFDRIKSNFLKFAYLCGAGIFDPNGLNDPNYIDVVFPRITNGDLAIVYTNYFGSFGFNLKICAVLVLMCFAEMVTISTIIQIIGRLCRMGKTYFGLCYLPPGIDVTKADYSNEIRNLRMLSTKDLELNHKNRALKQKPEEKKKATEQPKLSQDKIDAIMKQMKDE